MARDAKYGQVTVENGSFGDDEPVFILRAQDSAAVATLWSYRSYCLKLGAKDDHVTGVDDVINDFTTFAREKQGAMKVPD